MIQNSKSKLTDDDIKAQWRKQKEAHQKITDSVMLIGKALGLSVDSEGNLTGEADTPLVKSVQPSTSVQQDTSFHNCGQQNLKEAIKEALQEAVKGKAPDIVIGSEFYLANNKQAMDAVTSKWNDWLNGFLLTVAKQLQQIKVADASCSVAKPPSMMTRFFNRIYEDMTSCVWKGLAYFLAACALSFGTVGWYKYYKLVPVVKEYAIVRYVLEGKPANRKTIDGIDKLLNENDVDKVYEVWKQNRQ